MNERDLKYEAEEISNPVEEEVRRDVVAWQQSQERVLRYLKAIGVPPLQSLEITHKTLKLVLAESVAKRGLREHPTRVAMRLLGPVLAETDPKPPGLPPQLGQAMPAMPALNRSSMLPDIKPARLFKNVIAFLISGKISSGQKRPIV